MGIRILDLSPSPAVLVALLVTMASPARAQEPTSISQTADALFEQGKLLLDSGATEEACGRFSESQRLEPAVGTLGMLAWCHEVQGRTATAWREYLATAELASKGRDLKRERTARERASALQLRLSTVRVEVREPVKNLAITLSGSTLNEADWGRAIPIDPGQVPVRACADGFECWSGAVEVKGDSLSVVVEIPPLRPVIIQKPASPPPPLPPPPPAPRNTWVAPAVAGGVAVLGLGLGTYFGVRTISKTSQSEAHCSASNACDPDGGRLRDEARTSSMVSNVSIGIGLAATAVGVVLWLRRPEPRREGSPRPSVAFAPQAGVSSAGLTLSGAF